MTSRARPVPMLMALVLACSCAKPTAPAGPTSASGPLPIPTASTAPPPTMAAAIREWEARTGDLFKRSGRALQQVSDATDANDEAAARSGCQQLHDTNAVELQRLLPTPDPELTAELQHMIDDMNVATHACLRFVIARQPDDAATYQDYLTRAVDHLHQAKMILDSDLRPGR